MRTRILFWLILLIFPLALPCEENNTPTPLELPPSSLMLYTKHLDLFGGWIIRTNPPRQGLLGQTEMSGEKVIDLFLRPAQKQNHVRAVLAHELGHAFDRDHIDTATARQWMKLRGINPNASWRPEGNTKSDDKSPAGDFADCFAIILIGKNPILRPMKGPLTLKQAEFLRARIKEVKDKKK